MIQIGARNMQNFELLKAAGAMNKPVLLKRGISATIDEFINAAEYIMSQGNDQIILCERGIRTYESATRNTLDISAVPILKQETHLPVLVDVTHSTGRRDLFFQQLKQHLLLVQMVLWQKFIQIQLLHYQIQHNKWILNNLMNFIMKLKH